MHYCFNTDIFKLPSVVRLVDAFIQGPSAFLYIDILIRKWKVYGYTSIEESGDIQYIRFKRFTATV